MHRMTTASGNAKVVKAVRFGPNDFRHLRRVQKKIGTTSDSEAIRYALAIASKDAA